MITGINHVTLATADLDRAFDFYAKLPGARPRARWRRGAYLEVGGVWLCLTLDEKAAAAGRRDYSHIAFSVEPGRFDETVRLLVAAGAKSWQDNSSEGDSFCFTDPDGHRLELHVGDLDSRLASLEDRPYDDLELFRDQRS